MVNVPSPLLRITQDLVGLLYAVEDLRALLNVIRVLVCVERTVGVQVMCLEWYVCSYMYLIVFTRHSVRSTTNFCLVPPSQHTHTHTHTHTHIHTHTHAHMHTHTHTHVHAYIHTNLELFPGCFPNHQVS